MKLLMLGNGFDLYHKLPTTYLCFLQVSHLLDNKSEIPDNIASVFAKLKDKCKRINECYTAYENFYNTYYFDDAAKSDISKLKEKISNNMWYKFFWDSYNVNADWTDFEKEISKVLSTFSEVLSDQNLYDRTKTLWSDTENLLIRQFGVFFSIQDYATLHFNNDKYLIKSLKGENLYSVDKCKIYKDLYADLIELAEALKLYLSIFVENPLSKMKDIEKNDLFVGYKHVITFNYTNTYETLYGPSSMHYIHGKLDKDIVLGINPDKNDDFPNVDTSYIMFKKYYQRIYYRTDNSFIEMINNIKKDKNRLSPHQNSLVVCGHSLDITDQDIIKQVFDVSDSICIIYNKLINVGDYITNLIEIYGKSEFDRIRSEKQLRFVTYEEAAKFNKTPIVAT